MLPENKQKIINIIKKTDKVLDVGGWENPFPFATHVIDILPYETRKGDKNNERFSRDSWVIWDICDRHQWPYKDKEFDFVICSHLLEDVRDPLWVCSELKRVGKAGYIETPSRGSESVIGQDLGSPFCKQYAGFWHHRWIVELENNELLFTFKAPLVSLKEVSVSKCLDSGTVSFFWTAEFAFREKFVFDIMDFVRDQLDFIDSHGGRSAHPVSAAKLRFGIQLSKNSYVRKLYAWLNS